jgi:hypothetical protein
LTIVKPGAASEPFEEKIDEAVKAKKSLPTRPFRLLTKMSDRALRSLFTLTEA